MQRPFADKRIAGPFVSQSERFRDKLLGGDSGSTLSDGDILYIEVIGPQIRGIQTSLQDMAEGPLLEFVELEMMGESEALRAGGADPSRTDDTEIDLRGYYFSVFEVKDQDVTTGQIERFMEQELRSFDSRVKTVNIFRRTE